MATKEEQDKPFVVNDRRKFRMDGELREGVTLDEKPAPTSEAEPPSKIAEMLAREATAGPVAVNSATGTPEGDTAPAATTPDGRPLPPPPTPEEIAQVKAAYDATAERLDTMMRATNPGAEHLPPMDFTRLVQSVYMSAMMQLGAGTEQGQQARVDLLGAKQSIDMLGVIGEKSGANLSEQETQLIDAALFELRMGFLEITQLLARQSAAKQGAAAPGMPGAPPNFTGGGPRIVR